MSEDCKFCGFIVLGIICIVNFCLGTSEIIIGSVRYSDFDDACHDIRAYSIVAGIFNFVSSIILGFLLKAIFDDDKLKIRNFILLQCFQFLPIAANIWSGNIYFNITDHCKIFINNNMPEIWQYIIMMQFSLMWISTISFLFFIVCYGFLWFARQLCHSAGQ